MDHPPEEIALLAQFLDAQPNPACLFRRAVHPIPNPPSPLPAHQVQAVWSNRVTSPGMIPLAQKWIVDNADKVESAVGGKGTGPRNGGALPNEVSRIFFTTDIEGGTGSAWERSMRWELTPLKGGEYLAVVNVTTSPDERTPAHDSRMGSRSTNSRPAECSVPLEVDFISQLHHARNAAEVEAIRRSTEANLDGMPPWLVIDRMATEEVKAFYRTFVAVDWAASPLGLMETWDPLLRTHVNMCLSSPFPSLISWGPEMVLVYNLGYSNVIGRKHPFCLGNTYPGAWAEIWDTLEPVITDAYAGKGLSVEDQEMMLLRGPKLEESYFTYALIPIRGPEGDVVGIYIPNFDNTRRVLTERRIKSLHETHSKIALAHNLEDLVTGALEGLGENPRDMPFVLLYVADGTGSLADEEQEEGYLNDGTSHRSHSQPSVPGQDLDPSHVNRSGSVAYDGSIAFRLAGHTGCLEPLNTACIPDRIVILQEGETLEGTCDEATADGVITRCVRAALGGESKKMEEHDLSSVLPALQENTFGEVASSAVSLLIRSSREDRLHGILVFGLNTRKTFDKDYEDYIYLAKGLIATGMASLKLHNEDLNRARLLAAMNKRKNEELQVLLKKMQDELRALEARFFTSVEESPAGFWMVTDPESQEVAYVNPSFVKMTGMANMSPTQWREHVHPDDTERVEAIFADVFVQKIKTEFRYTFRDPSGEQVVTYVEASAGPILDHTGRVVFVTGTLLDVTARKLNEMAQTERAEQATAMRLQQENLIDFVSHELRNPLSAICLAMDSIEERLAAITPTVFGETAEDVQAVTEDASVVTLCTVHMQRLVDDVLVMSKLDNDMLQICPIPCCPINLVNSTMKLFTAELVSKGVDYEFKVGANMADNEVVKLDPHRTTQVLINLLTNAAKFTSNSVRRRITITLDASYGPPVFANESAPDCEEGCQDGRNQDLYVLFAVKDTGKGISPQNLRTLFQRFQQGNSKTHVNYGGHGLGLFICKRLSRLLGGDIHVESQEGKGSTFTFYVRAERAVLPVDNCQAPLPNLRALRASSGRTQTKMLGGARAAKGAVNGDHGRKGVGSKRAVDEDTALHVLLTEDNVVNLRLLEKQLIKAGARVYTAQNGVEALDQLRRSTAFIDGGIRIDCCLMDIEMPVMNGLQCTREIRRMEGTGEFRHRTPIIAVTANARDGQQSMMREVGMTDVVPKPFKVKSLMEKMRSLSRGRDSTGTIHQVVMA